MKNMLLLVDRTCTVMGSVLSCRVVRFGRVEWFRTIGLLGLAGVLR
jgi:hypothetical protein